MHPVRWFIAVVAAVGVCWIFPLFHVVPVKTADAEKAAATFDPAHFADNFWTNQLLASLNKAAAAEQLLAAITADAKSARTKFSRSADAGDAYYYFLSGTGRVVSFTDDEILIAIKEDGTNADVALQCGLIFGNALRDGTGLLNVSDFPNSQDFNGISEALNHKVESSVLPELRSMAKVGARIFFVGCAEVDDESTDLRPLKVIPIKVEAR